MLEDTKDGKEHRDKLNAQLDSQSPSGKPDRETWGKLPEHQRAMRAAMNA